MGIGASAGGLEAYTRLLRALPHETGFAFLLVPHLSPTYPSQLAELLASSTEFPVSEARDGEGLQPDHLYIVPPDKVMRVVDGRLRLEPRPARDGPPSVIDDCFASLAAQWRSEAVGIVLSGTGSDGAAGLKAIKVHGGTTYAQDFGSAEYEAMPRSAVEAGGVDFTLPPEAIARSLMELASSDAAGVGVAPREGARADTSQPTADEGSALTDEGGAALEIILGILQDTTGVDFRHYKRATLSRRISRRIDELGLPDFPAYVARLRESPMEIETLFNSVLIHVTGFFREPAMYEVLQTSVIPALIAHRQGSMTLRVWVVGCATGEEAYSTAIIFLESQAALGRALPVKIFATDLSPATIAAARLGRYPADIASEVSPERLERFFTPVDGGFQVDKRLREMCVFAPQDVSRDAPFAQLDLVICRNVLIYLEPVLQRRVLQVLHYALKPGGFLALGMAESVIDLGQLFSPLDRKQKVYLRRSLPPHLEPKLHWSAPQRPLGASMSGEAAPPRWSNAELQRAAAQAFFTRHAGGSVLVTSDLEIRHFQGTTSPWLGPPTGGPTVHLLKMAHPDLRLILGRLIRKAQQDHREASRRDVRVQVGSRTHHAMVTVYPVLTDETEGEHYLVVFEPVPHTRKSERDAQASPSESATADARVLELEQEVAETRDYLQAVIEQQDETHAELQAAYEASLSANEEFQSTNEELESTKEELQSVNEELTTVNEQLNQRNAELGARTAVVSGLLEAMDFPILLLTGDLRLQAFNARAAAQLRLPRTAIGRSITDIESPLPLVDLRELVGRAMDQESLQEQQVRDREGRWYALRLWPVRPASGPPTVVAALVDISELKEDVSRANEARAFSDAVFETVLEPLVVLDEEFHIVSANEAFRAEFPAGAGADEGMTLWEAGWQEWNIPELRDLLAEVKRSGKPFENYEVTIESPHSQRRTFRLNARRITHPSAGERPILLALEEITERRNLEHQMIEAGRMQAIGQLAGGVAHEINNQMTVVLGFAAMLSHSDHLSSEDRAGLAQIQKGAGRAADITRQLLTFSRRQPSATAAVELNPLVATSESMLRRILGPDIALEIRLGEDVGAIRMDQAMFEQVLANLVLNARDAMPRGGRLTIETRSVLVRDTATSSSADARVPSGRYARIIVRDTGSGMDEPTRRRIFEPFFTTKGPGSGTGLGLASVYGTVKQAGGFIWVESEKGRGTTFTIDLPWVESAQVPKARATPAVVPRGTETLLVAEDDENVRAWIARALRELGYTVLEAADGDEAFALVEGGKRSIALIVCDVMMPGMGGNEIRERLAQLPNGPPTILISAYGSDELVARGVLDRATVLISKPFEIAVLASRVRSVLDGTAGEDG